MSASLNASHVWDPASASSVTEPAPTPHDQARARFMALYEDGLESGRFEALVLPYWMLHVVLLGLYFVLVPPSWLDAKAVQGLAWRRWRRWILIQAKYPLFFLYAWRTVVIISMGRSPSGFMSYTCGILQSFFAFWFAALFLFREPRFDCMRLEREKVALDASSAPVHEGQASMASMASTTASSGHVSNASGLHSRSGVTLNTKPERSDTGPRTHGGEYRYYWQGLPPTLGHRAAWVLDLMTSWRGAGWAHQVRTLPVPPPEALAQLPASSPRLTAKPTRLGLSGPNARARLLRQYLATLAACYLILDLFKSLLVLHDPYYWGLIDAPFPPGLLPRVLSESPSFVRGLRTLTSGAAIVVLIIGTGTLILTIIFVCTRGDELKAEPWMWADLFGDPRSMLDHGLAGLWGEWWHQVMRITLSAPTEAISAACGWSRRDPRTQATATALAFLISGSIHAAGSYTQLGETQPFKPFMFFALQGLGIMVETLVGSVCARLGLRLSERYTRVVRGTWAVSFLCLTGPLFADDLAKGGEWLTEPLPFSLVRGLGLGPAAGSGWSMWRESLMWWHAGDVWWKSGFAS